MKEIDPLKFLTAVYMNADLPLSVRMRAAIELLPFTHPKLAVVAQVTENDIATLLDRRIKRYEEMKVIEAKPVNGKPQPQPQPQIIDQSIERPQTQMIEASKPLPRIADRRYRRI
jgi:hypothetical protein